MALTAADALRLIAKATFRPMDSYDHSCYGGVESANCYGGVESANALIHYADESDESYVIILDGNRICLIDVDGVESQFHLSENIFA
jgi:hypothetical protein